MRTQAPSTAASASTGEFCSVSTLTADWHANAITSIAGTRPCAAQRLQQQLASGCRSAPSYDEEPTLFAIDCEMCATANDDKALLSLCMVDVNGDIAQQVVRHSNCFLPSCNCVDMTFQLCVSYRMLELGHA